MRRRQPLQKSRRNITVAAVAGTAVFASSGGASAADIYFNNFGTSTISGTTYTGTYSSDYASAISSAVWTTSASGFTNFTGSSGEALSLSNSGGTPTITLTLALNAAYTLSLTGESFWRQRSNSGATAFSLSVNGTSVYTGGTVPTTGATTGTLAPTTTNFGGTAGLTTYTFTIGLSGASGIGTFRLDDFKLLGTLTSAGPPSFSHFDVNGTAASSGVANNGVYDLAGNTYFNAAANGTDAVGAFTTGQTATFSAGIDGVGKSYTVNVNTDLSAAGLVFDDGNVTLADGGGKVTLTGPGVGVALDTTAAVAAAIDGTAGLTKTGAGALALSGANTYSGLNTITAGVLQIAGDGSLGAAGNGVTFNGGTLRTLADVALASTRAVNGAGNLDVAPGTTLAVNGTYGSAAAGLLTLANAGTLRLAGAGNAAAGVTFASAGTLDVTGGTLTLGGNIIATHASGTATLAGAFSTGTSLRDVTVADGSADIDLNISANVSGTAGLDKYGPGTLVLSGANTYTGINYIDAGVLVISSDANLGVAANELNFFVSSAGTLRVASDVTLASRPVTGYGKFDIAAGSTLAVNGTYGTGTPRLLSLVNAGTLRLAGASKAAAGVSFTAPGTLDVAGSALTLSGDITTSHTAGTAALAGTVNTGNATRTVTVANGSSDVDLLISANLSGTTLLDKTGAGTLKLTGNNSGLTGNGSPAASIRLGTAASGTPTNGGTLAFDNANALGTGLIQLNGGTLRNDANAKVTLTNANGISVGARDATATPGGQIFAGTETEVTGPLQLFNSGSGYTQAISVNNATTFSGGFGAPSSGSSGVRVLGSGKATFSGAANNSSFAKPVFIGANPGSTITTTSSVTVLANATGSGGSFGTGAVDIEIGGTLAGTGTTGSGTVTVANSGTISAGSGVTAADSVGTLSTGRLGFAAGSVAVIKLANGGSVKGTSYDTINVTGLLNLQSVNAAAGKVSLLLRSIAGTITPSTTPYELVDASTGVSLNGSANVAEGADLTNLFVLNTDGVNITAFTYKVTAVGDGSGQDLMLSFAMQDAPEPTTAALALLGGSVVLTGRRRRPAAVNVA